VIKQKIKRFVGGIPALQMQTFKYDFV